MTKKPNIDDAADTFASAQERANAAYLFAFKLSLSQGHSLEYARAIALKVRAKALSVNAPSDTLPDGLPTLD